MASLTPQLSCFCKGAKNTIAKQEEKAPFSWGISPFFYYQNRKYWIFTQNHEKKAVLKRTTFSQITIY